MVTQRSAPEAADVQKLDVEKIDMEALQNALAHLDGPERESLVGTLAATFEGFPTLPLLRASAERPKRRLTADLPADVWDLLNETAERSGYNKLTTLVRAIRVFAELQETVDEGGEIILKEKDGTRARLILK